MAILELKEQDILNQIMDYLSRRNVKHVHIRNTGAIFVREGKTRFGRPKFHQKGAPDIMGCFNGRAFAIEVKSASGRVSDEQIAWLKGWEDAGGYFVVSRNLEQVVHFIDSLDIMKQ